MTRIDGLNTLGTSRTQAGSAAGAADSAKQAAKTQPSEQLSGPQDKVSVSSRSRIMADASASVASSPDVRQEKVMALQAAIANGTYSVDPRELAQRMFSSLQA